MGHAFLVRPDSDFLQSHLWEGDRSGWGALVEATSRAKMSAGVGLPGRVWASRRPEWLEEIDGGTTFPRGTATELGIRAAFAAPIVSDGRVVAILEFFSPVPHRVDTDLILIAQTLGDQVGRALERQQARDQQALVLGELEHRTKNMLAIVASMAAQTARGALSIDDYRRQLSDRLTALAGAYGLLTRAQWQATPLRALIREVVEPHLAPGSSQLRLTGDELLAPAKIALGLSMLLHELTTNAVKYGALSTPDGVITLDVSVSRSETQTLVGIRWTENGLTDCAAPGKAGFGTRLIERITRQDLGGTLDVDYPASGADYRLTFPLPG